jgi:hypothetical protein
MANYTFRTPTVSEGPIGKHRLFYFYKMDVGVSVYKNDGVYGLVRYVQDSYRNEVDAFYDGGCNHTVNDTIKAELIAANIGITEANFTAQ